MTMQSINVGTAANSKDGDPLRTAFIKINENFTELYNSPGGVASNKLINGAAELVLTGGANPFVTFPASGTDQLFIQGSEIAATSGSIALTSIDGSIVLATHGDLAPSLAWEFDRSGTLTTPLGLPTTFTATLNPAHFVGNLTLTGSAWYFEVQFQVGLDGTVQTMIGNNTPWLSNPGYTNNMEFEYTEADHGIPGYTFTLGLYDVVQAGPAGWTTNLTASQPPVYPSTVSSSGAIKLTADQSSLTFGPDGSLTLSSNLEGATFLINQQMHTNSAIVWNSFNGAILNNVFDEYFVIATNANIGTPHYWKFGTDGNLKLPVGGDVQDSNGVSVLGGGSSSPIQPYLELTNNPFIIQPVTFGEPVIVTAPVSGQGATFDVIIGSGPIIDTFTVANAGTGYVVGQRYKIWYYNVGSNTVLGSDITFEIATVGELGEILTVTIPQFSGVTPDNVPGTYSGVSIELTSSVRDEISPGVVLTRSLNQGLYNIVLETEYDNSSYSSPLATEWNSDGWTNLVGVGSRDFTTFRSALGGQVGNNVVSTELVMHDLTTDRYYKFDFTNWGQNNGGSYSYTRTEITDPNYFTKTAGGSEVDIIIADNGEGAGVGITRGANYDGVYNPYREGVWDSIVSPSGTQWNVDGWDDLSNIETRIYTNFNTAYAGNFSTTVLGSKAVMYVTDNDTYYAVEWLSWADDGTGAFSYVRYELDLTKINEGVKFPDGTVIKSAAGIGRVKSTASRGRRIEEVVGSNTVSVTNVNTNYITTVASRSVVDDNRFWVSNSSTNIAAIMNNPNSFGIQDYATIQFSLDNIAWYTYNGGYTGDLGEIGVDCLGGPFTYNQGDNIYFRYDAGGVPQVWWDRNDLPGGGANFRGAVIDYHAYTGEATWIGTIHIVDDSGYEHISHTEVNSGSTDGENDDLWLVQNEGTISYRRIDGESKTLKIHWTAKVFYGEEFYD